jgi:P pilus assembly chaperone PapD
LHRAFARTLILIFAALIGERAFAEASLFIYPTLVMFEGNRTSAEVTIANRGDETGTFAIGFADMSMTDEGGLVRQEDEMPWSIQPYLRYSPRRVTLAPAESQVIKIALRRDPSVPEGEYYSHMRVLTLNSAAVEPADDGAPEPEAGVSITARAAIAIPVVWRNSQAKPAATIESIAFAADVNAITVDVRRDGLLSVRGFLHVVAGSGPGESKSFAAPTPMIIYPTADRRSASLPLLEGRAAADLPRDARVVYSADEELTTRSVIYSEVPLFPER